MSDIDLHDAAASALRTAWLNGKANTTEGWALHVEADRLVEYIERAVRQQVAKEIEADVLDPVRGIPFDDYHDVATVAAWIGEWFETRGAR